MLFGKSLRPGVGPNQGISNCKTMKTNPGNYSYCLKFNVLLIVLLLLGGAAVLGLATLPTEIRSRASARILSITVNADGTVQVTTYAERRIQGQVMFSYGWNYQLKKGLGG
jgi:hypothetical protein